MAAEYDGVGLSGTDFFRRPRTWYITDPVWPPRDFIAPPSPASPTVDMLVAATLRGYPDVLPRRQVLPTAIMAGFPGFVPAPLVPGPGRMMQNTTVRIRTVGLQYKMPR